MAVFSDVIDLHYVGGGSDKVYHAALFEDGGTYSVEFAYGRRGQGLTRGQKIHGATKTAALKVLSTVMNDKLAKGYKVEPRVSGLVFPGASMTGLPVAPILSPKANSEVHAEFLPQLANAADDQDVTGYILSEDWGLMEKKDGNRVMLSDHIDGTKAYNRKGQEIPLVEEVANEASKFTAFCVIDGEMIGDTYYAFDILSLDAEYLIPEPFEYRHGRLEKFFESMKLKGTEFEHIKIVPLFIEADDKDMMMENYRLEKREGVIFRNLHSHYKPGRPNSGGDCIKVKFWEDASFFVTKVNAKRSVEVAVYFDKSTRNFKVMGNVTIPANHEIPEPGNVVDVRYLYAYQDGSIYQPIYRGKRTDIYKKECTINRIKFKNPEDVSEEDAA